MSITNFRNVPNAFVTTATANMDNSFDNFSENFEAGFDPLEPTTARMKRQVADLVWALGLWIVSITSTLKEIVDYIKTAPAKGLPIQNIFSKNGISFSHTVYKYF